MKENFLKNIIQLLSWTKSPRISYKIPRFSQKLEKIAKKMEFLILIVVLFSFFCIFLYAITLLLSIIGMNVSMSLIMFIIELLSMFIIFQ
jgi:hypothetical protein